MIDNFWRTHPYIRVLAPYLVGLCWFDDLYFLIGALATLVSIYIVLKNNVLKTSFVIFNTLICLGSIQGILIQPSLHNGKIEGVLAIEEMKGSHQVQAKISFRWENRIHECAIIVPWKEDSTYTQYHFIGNIKPHHSSTTVIQDKWSFLNHKGIYHQLDLERLQPIQYQIFNGAHTHPWIEKASAYLSPSEIAIVYALLIGNTHYLDSEVKSQYRTLGISHLLAVSGMHIGLLVILLQPLLSLLYFKKSKVLTTISLIVLLWAYCHLCQNAPSIVRACYMFTLLQLGQLFKKKASNINILCFSAFSMLIIDPSCIHDWGFILSHLAVMGLSLFQKTNLLLFYQCRPWKKYIGNTLLSSLQAQWITSPFLLFQTHVFPTYFLVANILLIPLSTLVLYTSIIGIVLCQYYPLPLFFQFWKTLIYGMNFIVQWLESWPHPQIFLYHFCGVECIALFGFGISIWLLMRKRFTAATTATVLFANLILIHLNWHFFNHPKEIHLFHYHGRRQFIYTNGLEQNSLPLDLPYQRFILEKGKNINPHPNSEQPH
jgi:ComEC/Rec2-related protein